MKSNLTKLDFFRFLIILSKNLEEVHDDWREHYFKQRIIYFEYTSLWMTKLEESKTIHDISFLGKNGNQYETKIQIINNEIIPLTQSSSCNFSNIIPQTIFELLDEVKKEGINLITIQEKMIELI